MSTVSKFSSLLANALSRMSNKCRCICIFQCCVTDSELVDQVETESHDGTPRVDLLRDYFTQRPVPNLAEVPTKYGSGHIPKAIP